MTTRKSLTVQSLPVKSLIVKLGAIGDVATVLPAAMKLRESGSEIDWLCGRSVLPLLGCYPWVHPIVVNDGELFGGNRVKAMREMLRVWAVVAGASYDLCAVLAYDRRYRLLTLPVRARRRVALDMGRREFKLVSERHHTAEYARILCGWPDDSSIPTLEPLRPEVLPANPLPRGERRRVALVPGGARNLVRDDPQRRWPVESYAELAKLLLSKGYEVVLTGGPSDAWVRPEFGGLEVIDCIGSWAIPELLAFYDDCDCVVTHDTGPMHLAGLTRCAMVALFGPTAPSKAMPRRNGIVGLWGGEQLACRPCYDGRGYAPCAANLCMQSIVPERVCETVEAVLLGVESGWRVEHL